MIMKRMVDKKRVELAVGCFPAIFEGSDESGGVRVRCAGGFRDKSMRISYAISYFVSSCRSLALNAVRQPNSTHRFFSGQFGQEDSTPQPTWKKTAAQHRLTRSCNRALEYNHLN